MKRFFAPNIDQKGRIIRAILALCFLIGACFSFRASIWLTILFGVAGVFTAMEALRGWCLARACGIKSRH